MLIAACSPGEQTSYVCEAATSGLSNLRVLRGDRHVGSLDLAPALATLPADSGLYVAVEYAEQGIQARRDKLFVTVEHSVPASEITAFVTTGLGALVTALFPWPNTNGVTPSLPGHLADLEPASIAADSETFAALVTRVTATYYFEVGDFDRKGKVVAKLPFSLTPFALDETATVEFERQDFRSAYVTEATAVIVFRDDAGAYRQTCPVWTITPE